MKGKKRYLFLFFIGLFFFSLYIMLSICFDYEKKNCISFSPFIISLSSWCKSILTQNYEPNSKIDIKAWKKRKNYNALVYYFFNNGQDEKIWKGQNKILHHSKTNEQHKFKFLSQCRLSNCFDFNKCKPGSKIKIHIYPNSSESSNLPKISSIYRKILKTIESSIYYEPDPQKACLFIPRYDYLDRDPLSHDYMHDNPLKLPENGTNHIIFNLFSGTYPSYSEIDMSGLNLGKSIFIKASYSYINYRPGFDISFPLFSKNHPEKGSTWLSSSTVINEIPFEDNKISSNSAQNLLFNNGHKNLLVFKGKRYTYGFGSETRSSLYHLHNDQDILIFTTCRHGKLKQNKDLRCSQDDREYDKYDYNMLMSNSTFCLVPRGRRLGSFRFLEALSYGCIPVILSNNWVKPFEEVIDWSDIVIEADERNLLQIPEILRSISWKKIERMRSQSIAIYEAYFASVEKIVFTTIAILSQRIHSHLSLNSFLWNLVNPGFTSFIGAIWFDNDFSFNIKDYPGYRQLSTFSSPFTYTAVIYVNKPVLYTTIYKLIQVISKSVYLSKIIFIWALPNFSPPFSSHRSMGHVQIEMIIPKIKTINAKFLSPKSIQTDAILSLEVETSITAEELDFAFLVWCSFPHRIVGFTARDHYFDNINNQWVYTSKWTNQYSIVLLESAFYHRYYNHLYINYISNNFALNLKPESFQNSYHFNSSSKQNFESIDEEICLDLIFNFLVSHVTREAPIKLTQRKKTTNQIYLNANFDSKQIDAFNVRQQCFKILSNQMFSYIPLIKSQLRLDPLLFKNSISIDIKQYLIIENYN